MKLSQKQDVRRVSSKNNKKGFCWRFLFFLKQLLNVKHSKKKVSRLYKSFSEKQKTPQIKVSGQRRFGIAPYNKGQKKENKQIQGIFVFIFAISVVLTGSTLFYFHQISSKLIQKKESIVNLYNKYQTIRQLNQKTHGFLETMQRYKGASGELLLVVDEEQVLLKKEEQAMRKYKVEDPSFQEKKFLGPLTWAFGTFFFCLLMRIFILLRERERFVYSELSPSSKGWDDFFKAQAMI